MLGAPEGYKVISLLAIGPTAEETHADKRPAFGRAALGEVLTHEKLINRPEDVPAEFLAGLALAHADILKVSLDPVYVVRLDAPVLGKTGIVSGGGSGHEPMHVGYVGKGMLDAACPGQVFTSPTPDQIEAATRAVNAGAGVLHIVRTIPATS